MKLFTQALMSAVPFDVREVKDPPAVVKFFGGSSFSYFVAEAQVITADGDDKPLSEFKPADLDDPEKVEDVILYGKHMPSGELGYASYNEFKSIKFPPFGLPMERDRYFDPTPLSQCK